MNNETRIKTDYNVSVIVITACISLLLIVFFIFFTFNNLEHEGTSKYIIILFIIPLFLQIFIMSVLCFQKSNYLIFISLITMALPYIYVLFAWNEYLKGKFSLEQSWACISSSSLIMAMIFATIWAIMRRKENGITSSNKLIKFLNNFFNSSAKEIKKMKFAMVCILLMGFISITYLLSFALAFHDKLERKDQKEAIHYSALGKQLIEEESYKKSKKEEKPHNPPNSGEEGKHINTYKIFFEEGSAIVSMDKNQEVLEGIINEVKKICRNSLYENIRVVLKGHCSKEPVAEDKYKKYSSNYELSEARTQNVKWEILKKLDNKIYRNNLQWEMLSMSNEEAGKQDKQWQSVEVLIENIKTSKCLNPTLLDYIYFTIYTITTTGYGDIIPVTPHAKFITSVANIFEVFFLVIFFNALFTLGAKEEKQTGTKGLQQQGEPQQIHKQEEKK